MILVGKQQKPKSVRVKDYFSYAKELNKVQQIHSKRKYLRRSCPAKSVTFKDFENDNLIHREW